MGCGSKGDVQQYDLTIFLYGTLEVAKHSFRSQIGNRCIR